MVRMPHWPALIWHRKINLGLQVMNKLVAELDFPNKKLPVTLHVTGTNGKGSTIAFLKSILESAGLRVHTYTSPNILRFNERICLAGEEISDDFLYEMIENVRIAAEKISIEPTLFEATTAAAFLAFSKIKADILLLEVGMGGTLDATNIVDSDLSIITPISLDHSDLLGDSMEKIAADKAGIMRKEKTCIIALQEESVMKVLEGFAQANNVKTFAFEYDYIINKHISGFSFESEELSLDLPNPSLKGDHQYINAATAIASVTKLKEFSVSKDAIKQGIISAKWIARLQHIKAGALKKLIPDDWQIWIDGAHNEAGAHVLSLWAKDQIEYRICLICGMTKGRDIKKFLSKFKGIAFKVAGMLVESEASSYKASDIANAAGDLGFASLACDNFEQAFEFFKNSTKDRCLIIICGSLYLASDALLYN